MIPFGVGDKIYIFKKSLVVYGMRGVIKHITSDGAYAVEFPRFTHGHNCGGLTRDYCGHWVYEVAAMRRIYETKEGEGNKEYVCSVLKTSNPTSQVTLVLRHMLARRKKGISQLEAMNYGIRRLASRINDIKNLGVTIHVTRRKDLNQTPYVRYSLA